MKQCYPSFGILITYYKYQLCGMQADALNATIKIVLQNQFLSNYFCQECGNLNIACETLVEKF